MSEFEKAMMRILSVILIVLLIILYLRLLKSVHTDNLSKRHSSPTDTPAIIFIAFSIYGYLIYLLFNTLYKML